MSSTPDVAFEVPCPRCKILRRVAEATSTLSARATISYARSFQPHPAHITSGPGPYFVTGVLCESLVLGSGRVINGGRS